MNKMNKKQFKKQFMYNAPELLPLGEIMTEIMTGSDPEAWSDGTMGDDWTDIGSY